MCEEAKFIRYHVLYVFQYLLRHYVLFCPDRHRDILRGEGRKISSSEIEARQLGKHASVEQTEATHEDRKHDTVDAPGTEANSEKHDSVVAMEEVQRGSKHESGGAAAMRQDDSKRDNTEETKVRQEESKHGGVKASKTGQEDGEDGTVEATELKEDDIKHQTQEGMHTRGGDNKQDGVAANEARKDRKQHGSMKKNEPEYGNSTDHSVPDTDNFMSVHGDRLTKRFLGFISKPNITIADMFEEEEIVSILLNMMSSTKYKCDDIQRMGVPVPKDGGYYVCMDVGVKPENCIVYSVGIRNLWSFDDAMADYGCNVYCFDPFHDLKTHRRSERVMFYDIALCGDDEDERKFIGKHPPVRCRTLESLKKMLHHEKEVIDVLNSI
ncbi:uncharacterized protein [Ptychodera flava]|uniref:uncharacterized protein isoform X2 n=1 Tax=Ptychodera flava TaxID=63121 RepID=UPI00396A9BAE